jgi:hypothetical protein
MGGQVVPVAFVNVCPVCDEHVITETEWQRITRTKAS